MLYNGEVIGDGSDPKLDIAVDPIDGTTLLSKGLPGAIAVIAMSGRGTMNVPVEVFYMDKIASGPRPRTPSTSTSRRRRTCSASPRHSASRSKRSP